MNTRDKILVAIIILGIIGIAISFSMDFLYIPQTPPENLTDVEITLERTACYGTCPIYTISISGDGSVTYRGEQFVKTIGVQKYNISAGDVEELVALIYQKSFFSLRDRYEIGATDMPTVITTVRVGDQIKSVENYGRAGPAQLHEIEQKIDELSNSESLWK